jgi:hypothetical protein
MPEAALTLAFGQFGFGYVARWSRPMAAANGSTLNLKPKTLNLKP